jgi:hypothetical protein
VGFIEVSFGIGVGWNRPRIVIWGGSDPGGPL